MSVGVEDELDVAVSKFGRVVEDEFAKCAYIARIQGQTSKPIDKI